MVLLQTRRGMRAARAATVLALAGVVAGCASTRPPTPADAAPPAAAAFVIVRHAEKAGDDPRDPTLSAAGQARAQALATALSDTPLVAAYATQYRRTQLTAQPAAQAHGVALSRYDASEPADALASRLRVAHAGGTVLVVGHSNTVPALVAALCGCAVAPMADDAFGDLYRVDLARDGRATLRHGHF